MSNNINIAEILKDYPKGMKLYSPLLGNVTLEKVDINSTIPIRVNDGFNSYSYFTKTGLYYDREDGECLLFPSSKMRDWTKFFKRGDVVRNKAGNRYAIFDCWESDDYTNFNTTINYSDKSFTMFYTKEVYNTNNFVKADNEEVAVFIANAEKYYDGKYNPKTLQVESIKSKCEFKPFDKEPKYRPFKNKEECLNEMQNHQPFGWVKSISHNYYSIIEITDTGCIFIDSYRLSFSDMYKYNTFVDGTPFGIKE